MTYGQFSDLIAAALGALNSRGLGRGDALAIVLSNGPEMAAAFLASACAVTAAPLNPAYREDEFHFYMDDLKVKALLVEDLGQRIARHRGRPPSGDPGSDTQAG